MQMHGDVSSMYLLLSLEYFVFISLELFFFQMNLFMFKILHSLGSRNFKMLLFHNSCWRQLCRTTCLQNDLFLLVRSLP